MEPSKKSRPASTGKKSHEEQLFSRQIYAIGDSAMNKLRKANVLIHGVGSIGVEIAKNLILAGVHHVTIHDPKSARLSDLSAQYYLSEDHIDKSRADSCFEELSDLNDLVNCKKHSGDLTDEDIKSFDLVIATDMCFEKQIVINELTRKNNSKFISADARGLMSYIFVDNGRDFEVVDRDGENCIEVTVELSSSAMDVCTTDGSNHNFQVGDYIIFKEVVCLKEMSDADAIKITDVPKIDKFSVGNGLANFLNKNLVDEITNRTGRAMQVKKPETHQFKSLSESLGNPDFLEWDFAKSDRTPKLHLLWQALYKFEQKYDKHPDRFKSEDVELFKAELPPDEIDEDLIKLFMSQARGNLQPVASYIGGFAAQEAMKAITNHTTPLKQFLYADSTEALHGYWDEHFDIAKMGQKDFEPRGTRYDGQAAIFGWPLQEALHAQRWFIVGAGAIGCELLKNMTMMGVGCGKEYGGAIQVTDMDTIELSNLNRQFLFRKDDIRKRKSKVAAKAAKKFNNDLNITAYTHRVAEDTENFFNDEFFKGPKGLTGVANALDNLETRRYMDRRCVYYQIPLLESGTIGYKGNVQVVYPYITESYGSSSDPPEKETPACTLRNFPFKPEHVIQWAREKFGDCFSSCYDICNDYLQDNFIFCARLKKMNQTQQLDILRSLKRILITERPESIENCVHWARDLFDTWFHNDIVQMLHVFPRDYVADGIKFWSGTKRCPTQLEYDPDNETHNDFIYAASIIRAQMFELFTDTEDGENNADGNSEPTRDSILEIARAYISSPFTPRSDVRIAVTDAEAAAENANAEQQQAVDQDETQKLIDVLDIELARRRFDDVSLIQIDFEKDDDANHHMDFITAASNLRAANYGIDKCTKMEAKQIAGKIIPALATTTAVAAGLACLELYKMVAPKGKVCPNVPLSVFRNSFFTLASPYIGLCEPIAAPVRFYANGTKSFTLWDCLELKKPNDIKFGDLIKWIQDETKADVTMLSSGTTLLFAFFQPEPKKLNRAQKMVMDVVVEASNKPILPHVKTLVFEPMVESDGVEIEVPYVKYTPRYQE